MAFAMSVDVGHTAAPAVDAVGSFSTARNQRRRRWVRCTQAPGSSSRSQATRGTSTVAPRCRWLAPCGDQVRRSAPLAPFVHRRCPPERGRPRVGRVGASARCPAGHQWKPGHPTVRRARRSSGPPSGAPIGRYASSRVIPDFQAPGLHRATGRRRFIVHCGTSCWLIVDSPTMLVEPMNQSEVSFSRGSAAGG